MTTTTSKVQLLGADPIDHDRLVERAGSADVGRSAGTSWQDRLIVGVQFRDVEIATEGGYSVLRGMAVPYDEWASIGYYLEAFRHGSLWASIQQATKVGRQLPLNLFHDNRSFPIGAATDWTDDKAGLVGEWRLDSRDEAQEAARQADEGLITGLSIEFAPIRSEWEYVDDWNPSLGPDFMDKCVRIEARLGAVGLVQTPAYVQAGVELVRSADARRRGVVAEQARSAPALTEWKAELERLRASDPKGA